MSKGYIYILSNPGMPGLLKIGKTTKDPQERASELSASTASPFKFEVIHSASTDDCNLSEKDIHKHLKKHRANSRREFFSVSEDDAKRIINQVCSTYNQFKNPLIPFNDRVEPSNSIADVVGMNYTPPSLHSPVTLQSVEDVVGMGASPTKDARFDSRRLIEREKVIKLREKYNRELANNAMHQKNTPSKLEEACSRCGRIVPKAAGMIHYTKCPNCGCTHIYRR